jgi:hypothetical protein
MRIEMSWLQKEGVSQLIQIDFMIDQEFEQENILIIRDQYIDMYKNKKWEELFAACSRSRYVVIMNMPQTEVVTPNKYIVQGLSSVLDVTPETT